MRLRGGRTAVLIFGNPNHHKGAERGTSEGPQVGPFCLTLDKRIVIIATMTDEQETRTYEPFGLDPIDSGFLGDWNRFVIARIQLQRLAFGMQANEGRSDSNCRVYKVQDGGEE